MKQVRDKEFRKELNEQTEQAVKLNMVEKDQLIADLQAKIARFDDQKELAVRDAIAQERGTLLEKEQRIAELELRLTQDQEKAASEKAMAIRLAEAEKEKELTALRGQLNSIESQYALREKELLAERDTMLRVKEEELAQYKDMKARLSSKMVGETLEQHCEAEFNKVRALGFAGASFEKDNDASGGSKGDYIFRDFDENGLEYISIMFEMKNEMDETATKHKNEDFLKKLDKDRCAKKCEYAVLVSLLEPENEYYNTGIVDVSHRFEKCMSSARSFSSP